MVTRCIQCGKDFDILYPDLWRYRRGDFLCSYGCMRKHDKREEENGEMKRLKKDGSPAQRPGPKPKKQIIETPEGEFTQPKPEIPEKVATVKLTGPLNVETPEPEKVTFVDGGTIPFKMTGMSTEAGDFQYFKKAGYLDWTPGGTYDDTVSLKVEEWKALMKVLPVVIRMLGVEL